MSSRPRNGSSSAHAAGTTAVPPDGSAAIASAFASATRSTVPRSSRCSGPMCGTTTTLGPRDRAERGDLTETAHAHLGDEDARVRLEPADRERQADLVVQALLRPDRRHMRRAERTEDVLRRRLPGRADDCDDLRARSSTGRASRAPRAPLPGRRDERGRSACARLVDEPDARVRARRRGRPARPRASPRLIAVITSPARRLRAARARAPRAPPSASGITSAPRSASRTTTRSSNGVDDAGDLLALLVTLAGDDHDVAGLGERRARVRSRCAGRDRSRRRARCPAGRPR